MNLETTPVSPDRAANAFNRRISANHTNNNRLIPELDDGRIECYSLSYQASISRDWANLHPKSQTESGKHLHLKLVLADFLADLGHQINDPLTEMEAEVVSDPSRESVYTPFEVSYSEGIADVAVLDDNHSIIGEVGDTPPKKMVGWVGRNQDAVFLHVPYNGVDREVSSKSPSTEVNSALNVEGRDAIAEYTYSVEILAFVEQQANLRQNLCIS